MTCLEMTRNRKLFVASLALLSASLSTTATAAEVELTPTLGYRSGGYSCEESDTPLNNSGVVFELPRLCSLIGVEAEDDVAFGVILGVGIGHGLQMEVLANRQEAQLRRQLSRFVFAPFLPLPDVDFTVTHLQAGLSKTWGAATVRPFVGLAAGVSRVDANDPALLTDFREDAFSASLGAGVKTYLNDRFGLRFEGRGYWIDLPREVGGDFTQEELSVGAILRW